MYVLQGIEPKDAVPMFNLVKPVDLLDEQGRVIGQATNLRLEGNRLVADLQLSTPVVTSLEVTPNGLMVAKTNLGPIPYIPPYHERRRVDLVSSRTYDTLTPQEQKECDNVDKLAEDYFKRLDAMYPEKAEKLPVAHIPNPDGTCSCPWELVRAQGCQCGGN